MGKVMEMWTCKRYSKEHAGVCVEPGKIKVIPLKDCEETLKRELTKKETMLRRDTNKLKTELDKLKKGNK